jgi:hypothetical protein
MPLLASSKLSNKKHRLTVAIQPGESDREKATGDRRTARIAQISILPQNPRENTSHPTHSRSTLSEKPLA